MAFYPRPHYAGAIWVQKQLVAAPKGIRKTPAIPLPLTMPILQMNWIDAIRGNDTQAVQAKNFRTWNDVRLSLS